MQHKDSDDLNASDLWSADWSALRRLNEAIFDELVRSATPHLPLYIDADDEIVKLVIGHAGLSGESSNVIAAAMTPTLESDLRNTFRKHHDQFIKWRSTRSARQLVAEQPPYLAVLFATVMAAERMNADGKVAANNYYVRLCELFGIPDPRRKQTREMVANSFRKHVVPMWNDFNRWLDGNRGDFGTSTAYPVGGFPYVGIPIGQALVRSADRLSLIQPGGFFEQTLVNGEKWDLEADELRQFFDEWLRRGSGTVTLRNVWSREPDLVLSVLREMYDEWEPTGPTPDGSTRTLRIHLRLLLSTQPVPRITATLVLPTVLDPSHDLIHGTMIDGDSESTEFPLEFRSDTWGLHGLEIFGGIDLSAVLARRVRIDMGSSVAERYPAAVIPLVAAGPRGLWEERSIGQRATQMSLLVAENLSEELEDLLTELAQVGWRSWESVKGLPVGWRLYTNVVIVRQPTRDIPLGFGHVFRVGEEAAMGFVGGLRLLGAGVGAAPEYLIGNAPDLLVAIPTPDGTEIVAVTSEIADEIRIEVPDSGTVVLNEIGLSVGNYRLELRRTEHSKKCLTSRRIAIRSADLPRRDSFADASALAIRFLDDDQIVVSEGAAFRCQAVVQGGRLVSGNLPLKTRTLSPGRPTADIERSADDTIDIESDRPDGLREGESITDIPSCFTRPTAHYFRMGDHLNDLRPNEGRCVYCGLFKVHKVRKAGDYGQRVVRHSNRLTRSEVADREVHPVNQQTIADDLLILEALSAIGAGGQNEAQVLHDLTDDIGIPASLWRLAAAGHIDTDAMLADQFGGRWRMTPSTLAMTQGGRMRLVGFRSPALLSAIERSAAQIGGSVETNVSSSLESTEFLVTGVDSSNLEATLARSVNANLPDDVLIDFDVDGVSARNFIRALPVLSRVPESLRMTTFFPSNQARRYNFESWSWEPLGEQVKGQAIQVDRPTRRYMFAIEGGEHEASVIEVGYRLAKHLAANFVGRTLVDFDPARREIVTRLGVELPLLYARAVIFATGQLPYAEGGTVRFPDVSEEIWEVLIGLLTN